MGGRDPFFTKGHKNTCPLGPKVRGKGVAVKQRQVFWLMGHRL